jgi:DNA-binding transcriptional ArsR family regulator
VPTRKTTTKATRSPEVGFDRRLVRAISHPIRHRVLVALTERVASPKELAAELGEPLGNVSYHTRVLAQMGAIELVKTEQRRGALEHYYRAIMRPYFDDATWAQIPVSTRRALFDQDLDHLWNDVVEAAKSGGLDHPRAHVSWTALDLDEQGLNDLADLLGATLERALDIEAEVAGRRGKAGDDEGPGLRTELGILHFERAVKRSKRAKAGDARQRRTTARS